MSGYRAGLHAHLPEIVVVSFGQPQLICFVCLTDVESCLCYLFVISSSDIADRFWPCALIARLAFTSICLNP